MMALYWWTIFLIFRRLVFFLVAWLRSYPLLRLYDLNPYGEMAYIYVLPRIFSFSVCCALIGAVVLAFMGSHWYQCLIHDIVLWVLSNIWSGCTELLLCCASLALNCNCFRSNLKMFWILRSLCDWYNSSFSSRNMPVFFNVYARHSA